MKKVSVLALFFALTVLAGVVFAAGGDSSDPLISLSYLQGTFRDKVDRSIDSKLDTSDKAAYAQAESALRAAISALVKTRDPSYNCVITIDRSFVTLSN